MPVLYIVIPCFREQDVLPVTVPLFAAELDKTPKVIDNAMQRIKKKIYAYLGIGN